MPRSFVALLFVLMPAVGVAADPAPKPSAAQVEFFESKVRPVLAEHCYGCHGPKKQNAGLRLDTAAGLKAGADSGPVVVPGDVAKSLLLKAVRRETHSPMPPKGPLPADAVAVLAAWVKDGAAFPDDQAAKPAAADPKSHWAFRPPSRDIRNPKPEIRNPIDGFILDRLEKAGLKPAPEADRRTQIRRAYLDLHGLSPTAAEVEAFEKDAAPDAYEKLIDRLLASPRYGERWGRYWLDVARYADNKGYVFQEERNFPYSYTYRDYVIRAFNDDKPFDRFVVEQLAADRLDLGADKSPLAAMGLLTLGRRFLNNTHDIIDDRLDVVGRGLMGLTITCARCHDHKFDPVPQKDYYSLYGVFASSAEPKELPLIGDAKPGPEYAAFEKELAKLEKAVADETAERHAAFVAKLRTADSVAAYLLAVAENRGPDPGSRGGEVNRFVFDRWKAYLVGQAKGPVFAPLASLIATPEKGFAAKVEKLANDAKSSSHPLVLKALADAKPATLKEAVGVYAKLLAESKDARLSAVLGKGGPTDVPVADFEKVQNRADRDRIRALQKKVDAFKAASPAAPPRAMVLTDSAPVQPVVFLRGNPMNRGPAVPRQFLEVLSGPDRKPFGPGSGRLELANAIASKDNPLTARVIVNRVWGWHFGAGIVRTPSDFGVRSDPPTHPELLDWLASEFVSPGTPTDGRPWALKRLHKLIMTSATYRQSSFTSAEAAKLDPENRLLSHQNRRRLDFEALRDSTLAAAGQLDIAAGGKPVDLFKAPFAKRRTVYGFIDRSNVPGTFRSFDVASSDQHAPLRYQTTVPQQALFLMNSPFVMEQAKALAARPEVSGAKTDDARVRALYRAALGRSPTTEESAAALAFAAPAGHWTQRLADGVKPFGRWEQLSQVLLLSNEFAFAD